jgi:hypothetical protein
MMKSGIESGNVLHPIFCQKCLTSTGGNATNFQSAGMAPA